MKRVESYKNFLCAFGFGLTLLLLLAVIVPMQAHAFTFESEETGKMVLNGSIKASFGATQYLDFVDGPNGRALDSEFDATRELGLTFQWIANENLKGVASFQIGEGSTGGYFGSTDALVGGEEDGDLIFELDKLYIDFTVPNKGINFTIGSQSAVFPDAVYGSNLMYEIPAGVTMSALLSDIVSLKTGWFRIADLMDDTENNMDDQADLLYLQVPVAMKDFQVTPYAAYANIQEDVIINSPNHWRYAYFDYPAFLQGSLNTINDSDAAMPTDDVRAYYLGTRIGLTMFDPIDIRSTLTYGNMSWDSVAEDVTISGFFADLVVDYKMKSMTPEVFGLYGSGPDENDEDLDMMPPLIGGPTYTSSYFGGSRFNDNMFDSHDTTYATSMRAVGFKLKDIKLIDKLTNEFQLMYAQGTAEDTIFQAPYDELLNEDESFVELNFNSEYEIIKNLIGAVELGYIVFDEDGDYDEAANGDVENFWKAAAAIEYYF